MVKQIGQLFKAEIAGALSCNALARDPLPPQLGGWLAVSSKVRRWICEDPRSLRSMRFDGHWEVSFTFGESLAMAGFAGDRPEPGQDIALLLPPSRRWYCDLSNAINHLVHCSIFSGLDNPICFNSLAL